MLIDPRIRFGAPTVRAMATRAIKEMPDDQWLPDIGQRDWFVVRHNYMLHRRANELQAIRQYNIGIFYLWGAKASRWEKMRAFARAYDRIIRATDDTSRPFVYRVQQNGRLIQLQLPQR